MPKPVFASDIDDTLIVGTVKEFFDWIATQGIPHCRDTYARTHKWGEAIPGHDPDFLFEQFYLSGKCPPLTLMPGAPEAIMAIMEYCEVHLVSRRNDVTIKQVDGYLTQALFAKYTNPGIWACGKTPKQVRLREIQARIFVDDSLHELEQLEGYEGLTLIQFPSFLKEEPHPQRLNHVIRLQACERVGQEDPNILRVQAWQEIVSIVRHSLSR